MLCCQLGLRVSGLWVMSYCPPAGPARRHPPVLRMVLEALQEGEQRRGTSVMAIKVYILQKYPMVDAVRLKYLLKRALDTGMQRGLLVRPTNSKAKGATGSFKVSLLGRGGGGGGRRKGHSAPGFELQFQRPLPGLCVLLLPEGLSPQLLFLLLLCLLRNSLSPPRRLVCVPPLSPHMALVIVLCSPSSPRGVSPSAYSPSYNSSPQMRQPKLRLCKVTQLGFVCSP